MAFESMELRVVQRANSGAQLDTLRGCSLFYSALFTSLCAAHRTLHPRKTPPHRPPQSFHFVQPEPINFDDHDGWTQIFDGKTLNDWDGDTDIWHVEDGAIVGESSPEHPSGTTNIIWRGGEPANFELKLEMKLEGSGANGGVQYRSFHVDPKLDPLARGFAPEQRKRMQMAQQVSSASTPSGIVSGYQADFDFNNKYTGQLYEQNSPRGIIAWRSQVVATEPGKKPTLLATLGSSDELKSVNQAGRVEPGGDYRGRQYADPHHQRAHHVCPRRYGSRSSAAQKA